MTLRRRAWIGGAVALAALGAAAAPPPAERARIERLIGHLAAQRDAQFVRNGAPYSPREAALFLRAKFEKTGEHVGTALQFIEQIATRSSTTGQPYLIRFADGRTMAVAEWLGEELRRMDVGP